MDVLFYLKMEKAVLQARGFKPNLLIMFVFEVTINPVGINWWSRDDAAGVSPTVIKIR